jgi:hypothetical protein
LAEAIAKYVGLDAGAVKKLLTLVAPLVMGAIAKQFQGRPATAQGLKTLFAEQQPNIAAAMPEGLSLADVPGLGEIGSAASRVAGSARRTADAAHTGASSLMKALLPIAALALLAFLAWQFLGRRAPVGAPQETAGVEREYTVQRPAVNVPSTRPDATQFSSDLRSVYATATETLSGITDAASAEAALPALNQLSSQIDGLRAVHDQLPETARKTIAQSGADNFDSLSQLIEKVLAIPGVGAKLEPVLKGMMNKLTAMQRATE